MKTLIFDLKFRGFLVVCLIGLMLLVSGGFAWAMRVSPMVAELTTRGAGSSARIEVGNVGSASLPFETSIYKLTFADNGDIIETPADEDFLVFPPQGLVPVNGRQMVRLQWIGDPSLEVSEAYYLAVRQLPVAAEPTESESGGAIAVQVLYNMKALIVVAPPGAAPDVKVISAQPTLINAQLGPDEVEGAEIPEPLKGVQVVVRNDGKRYALMSGATWTIEGTTTSGQPYRHQLVAGNELAGIIGVGYLAPVGGVRTFNLPTGDVELDPSKPISVKFSR
jgi:fimbrial chaperone protein